MMNLSWQERAACKEADTELFFPSDLGSRSYYDYEQINNYCNHCPVQQDCLEYALKNNIMHGIWGGKSRKQRRAITREVRINSLRSA